jgi:hypothetical protein
MPRTIPPWEVKREHITKANDSTSPQIRLRTKQAPSPTIHPIRRHQPKQTAGPTSHEVAAWTKKSSTSLAIGQWRTLDPNKSQEFYPLRLRIQQKSFKPTSTAAKNTFVL